MKTTQDSNGAVLAPSTVRHFLCTNSWAGYNETEIELLAWVGKMARIKAIKRTVLGGRRRWIDVGETALVPRHAIKSFPNRQIE